MIKKLLTYAVLFFLFTTVVRAEDTHPPVSLSNQNLTNFAARNHVSEAAVILYQEGKSQSFYVGDIKPTTSFNIQPLSDVMIGLLLAQQFDAAKLQLTTPIKQFFPSTTEKFSQINLRNLATDTSGLPVNAAETILASDHQDILVDETWQPSNFARSLLTKILENSTHKNLAELYQRQIFSALKMTHSKLTPEGLISSVSDMQKFLAAAIGLPGTPETILYPMRLTQTAFVELPNRMLGLGWDINIKAVPEEQEGDNNVVEVPQRPVFKADGVYEKRSSYVYLAALPNKKSGIVILLNAPVDEKELTQLGRQMAGLSK